MILVHDDDLARVAGIYDGNVSRHSISAALFIAYPRSQGTLVIDEVMDLLQQSQPDIQQVQCGTWPRASQPLFSS